MELHDQLVSRVRAQALDAEAWQEAELHLLELAYRQHLEALGVTPCPELAAGLMAAATLLGEGAPEWGGDVRCTLGELAQLGLRLLEGDTPAA